MEVGICKGPWRRAWRYPAYLWSLRWVYAVKKTWRLVYSVYPGIPPIHHCCYPKKDGTTAVIFCFFSGLSGLNPLASVRNRCLLALICRVMLSWLLQMSDCHCCACCRLPRPHRGPREGHPRGDTQGQRLNNKTVTVTRGGNWWSTREAESSTVWNCLIALNVALLHYVCTQLWLHIHTTI